MILKLLLRKAMAQRFITAILWTLVSVNSLTLVMGGLTTWLGYAIPIRLKQFGLAPELAQAAGFASLLVSCLGLCALNYSSHYALNVYGFACAIFAVLMIFGIIPEEWSRDQRAVALAAHQHRRAQAAKALSLAGTQLTNSSSVAQSSSAPSATNGTSSALAADQDHNHHGKSSSSSQAGTSGILLDLIYFSLLALLVTLLMFAFTLAQYLRRKEAEEVDMITAAAAATSDDLDHQAISCVSSSTAMCTCDNNNSFQSHQFLHYQQRPQQMNESASAYSQYNNINNNNNNNNGQLEPEVSSRNFNNEQPSRFIQASAKHLLVPPHVARRSMSKNFTIGQPILTTQQQEQIQDYSANRHGDNNAADLRRTNQLAQRSFLSTSINYQGRQRRRVSGCLRGASADQQPISYSRTGQSALVHKGFYHASGSMSQEDLHHSDGLHNNNEDDDDGEGTGQTSGRTMSESGAFKTLGAELGEELSAGTNNIGQENDGVSKAATQSAADNINGCGLARNNSIKSCVNSNTTKTGALPLAASSGNKSLKTKSLGYDPRACRCHLLPEASSNRNANALSFSTLNPWIAAAAAAGSGKDNVLFDHSDSRYLPQYYCTMPRLNLPSAYTIRPANSLRSNKRQQQQQYRYRHKPTRGSSVMAMTAAAAAAALLGGVADSSLFNGTSGNDIDAIDDMDNSNFDQGYLNESMMGDADLLAHHHQAHSQQMDAGQYGFEDNNFGLYANAR